MKCKKHMCNVPTLYVMVQNAAQSKSAFNTTKVFVSYKKVIQISCEYDHTIRMICMHLLYRHYLKAILAVHVTVYCTRDFNVKRA